MLRSTATIGRREKGGSKPLPILRVLVPDPSPPSRGAWIETRYWARSRRKGPGRLLHGGVDRNHFRNAVRSFMVTVAFFTGAWIETPIALLRPSRRVIVASFTGA